MLKLIYYIFINIYYILLYVISPFHFRAKNLISGRNKTKHIIDKLQSIKNEKRIWFHVSSLGEYEQGRPLMECLKKQFPMHKLVVTFYSPSGYEQRHSDPLCDYVLYLPFDSPKNARTLINAIQADVAIWVKYDFWWFYLAELKLKNTPILLISANIHAQSIYTKWYGFIQRKMLGLFNVIFTQNSETTAILKSIGISSVVSGDTRYDRVLQVGETLPLIQQFKGNHLLMVAGSTYDIEEDKLQEIETHFPELKFIIVPHHVDEDHLKRIEKRFGNKIIRYSQWEKKAESNAKILLIDCVGLLSRIYPYADIAYVGGGFKSGGLHNILEAAVCGKPVIIGPKTEKFPEAIDLINAKGAVCIKTRYEWIYELRILIQNINIRLHMGEKAYQFVHERQGATKVVCEQMNTLMK